MTYSTSSSLNLPYFSSWETTVVYGNGQIVPSVEYFLLGKTVWEMTDWILTIVTHVYR